jgi:hypothetical protein
MNLAHPDNSMTSAFSRLILAGSTSCPTDARPDRRPPSADQKGRHDGARPAGPTSNRIGSSLWQALVYERSLAIVAV